MKTRRGVCARADDVGAILLALRLFLNVMRGKASRPDRKNQRRPLRRFEGAQAQQCTKSLACEHFERDLFGPIGKDHTVIILSFDLPGPDTFSRAQAD
jgi:hypothetical protein